MAMDTKAYDVGNGYKFVVHLDTMKVMEDGAPDPEWVVELTWGKEPPEGQDVATYLASCKREAELLGQMELDKRTPPAEITLP